MGTFLQNTLSFKTLSRKVLGLPRASLLRLAGLFAIVALAAALRLVNLGSLGFANHYYSAAIQSMLQSWHNFFFVAAEPGGSVSVDKPPVGLWLQAVSAYFLGVNGFAMILPEILAGILSVVVLYHLVQRWFGTPAGLLAGLALAITPVVVATDRNNTIDSSLILVLLLAAWAFIKAAESARLRPLLLGGLLVGIGFNIKMLEAFLPLPAFAAYYFFSGRGSLGRKFWHFSLALVVTAVVSLSWVTIVDLTPASQRPYVGSSTDNSELNLILGYNGTERLFGMTNGSNPNAPTNLFTFGLNQLGIGSNNNSQFGRFGNNGGFFAPTRIGPGGGGANGFAGTGRAGLLRLFTAPLDKEMSWLLPLALFSILLLLFREKLHWPFWNRHQAVVLWGGWLLTGIIFFSIANFFHEYYLTLLAPPAAALVAAGLVELWRLFGQRPWLSLVLALFAAGGSLLFQFMVASEFVPVVWWLPLILLAGGAGMLLLLIAANSSLNWSSIAGFACLAAALLVTPGVWSILTALNPSSNQSLPAAYGGQSSSVPDSGGLKINQQLLDFLTTNTQGVSYLMAVPSAMQGSDYVLATGRPVLYLGGFMGNDNVIDAGGLAQLVADGKLRFIYWDPRGNGFAGGSGSQSDISSWLSQNCRQVPDFNTSTVNAGAPDGSAPTARSGPGIGFNRGGMMQVSLYDCGQ
jgi:4-amino-4-deoxy-L-arabinose transferase-like glycosyltransferase